MHQYNPRPIKTVLGLDAKSLLKELSYLVLSFTRLIFKSVIFTLFCLWHLTSSLAQYSFK